MATDDVGAENENSDAPKEDAKPNAPAEDKTVEIGKTGDAVAAEPTPAAPKSAQDKLAKGAAQVQTAAKDRSALVPIIAAFVAGVLLVAAVTAVVVFYRQASNRGDELDAHEAATAAACDYGKLISTYDPQTIDEYLKKVDAASTGDWKDQFAKLGQDLKGVVIDAKATSSTYDMQCGFQSGDTESANVLVVIGQTTTNVNIAAANKPPSKVELVVVAGLKKVGDKWLVDKFDLPILKQMGN
ncbi:hypothetical protein [Nocardia anaemiae]|uniref:hypothetical protein n=1 Tax=Nocardia anaemiae TaxID=263910 RepID=UPI000B2B0793|nr:hypothetical protein [Nocardia anaemiae]